MITSHMFSLLFTEPKSAECAWALVGGRYGKQAVGNSGCILGPGLDEGGMYSGSVGSAFIST